MNAFKRTLLPLVELALCVIRQLFILGLGNWLLRLDALLGDRLGVLLRAVK